MALIDPHQSVMSKNLSNAELFTLHELLVEFMNQKVVAIPRLQASYNKYLDDFNGFDISFKDVLASIETKKIEKLDGERKGLFRLVDHAVKDAAKYAVAPDVKEAAGALLLIFRTYAGTPKLEYEGKSGNITNLIQELEKPENAARIALLGQTANVAAMKQLNIDFQALYSSRYVDKHAHKQAGTTRQWRVKLLSEYGTLVQVINGLRISATAPAEIAALDEIIDYINATVEQYTVIVHRRLAIAKAHKKKEEDKDKEDEGSQTPATPPSPPPPPGTQQPDITPPKAPDIQDQTPTDEPHKLDPDEHPFAGE